MADVKGTLEFPDIHKQFLASHLPRRWHLEPSDRPFTTLTYATSLDAAISIAPGVQTGLSGPESKAMTHYLRSRHDAILVGVGTAIVDDPSLNCRLSGVGGYGGGGLEGQPRPVIIDPHARWLVTESTKVVALAAQGRGRAPWIITCCQEHPAQPLVGPCGGKIITLDPDDWAPALDDQDPESRLCIPWSAILKALKQHGIGSVMIEGGANVIKSLLHPSRHMLIDSVIITIAPVVLGEGALIVAPTRQGVPSAAPAARLHEVKWLSLGVDVVMCGKL